MTNKVYMLLLVILMSLPIIVSAQSEQPTPGKKQRVYAEIGSSLFVNAATINYEPTLFESKSRHFRINGRLGLGLGLALGLDGNHGVSGALGGLTMDFGRYNNHFLLGTGLIVGSSFNDISEISAGFNRIGTAPLLEIGWRYEKPTGGVIYKIAAGTLGLSFGVGYSF